VPDSWRRPTPARARRIRDRLRAVYGIPRMAPHGRPLDELVLTVLSQSTNDRNRDVAFLRLRERFARSGQAGGDRSQIDYAAMLVAPVSEVEEAIRPGGISKVKSARIQAILAAIEGSAHDPADPLSLEWTREAPIEQSRAYLCALPGVGRKTAACVLLFSYGLRDIPVDTHVSRVGMRLALLRAGGSNPSFEELHDQMLALTPPGEELELHVNLLRHGRRTCFARKPACSDCALARMCPSRGLFD
jgi:endonuclease-3